MKTVWRGLLIAAAAAGIAGCVSPRNPPAARREAWWFG